MEFEKYLKSCDKKRSAPSKLAWLRVGQEPIRK